tara:strand:- start:294 stop:626 length:333 start_codon:yes stop_codon:yes gene_type:complete
MKKGTVVEREYSISNFNKYLDKEFLRTLDQITEQNGITILNRVVNSKNKTVRIKARFDSNQWDVCQALAYMAENEIEVKPVSDFVIIYETNECKDKVKIVIEKIEEHEST